MIRHSLPPHLKPASPQVRHHTLCTTLEAMGLMAGLPSAFAGGSNGDFTFILLVSGMVAMLLSHQTYYTIVVLGVGIASRFAHAVTVLVGLLELALLVLLVAAVLNGFLAPAFDNLHNALYSTAYTYIGAALLMAVILVGTIVAIAIEGWWIRRLIDEEEEAVEGEVIADTVTL